MLSADARIDNRDELVPLLVRLGFLATELDETPSSEIILAAYRCWGDDAPAKLIGDFAFVIWDGRRRRLLAARDPMGMRPLVHCLGAAHRVVLGSEVSQLLAVPGVPRTIDERGIAATIAGPYLSADATLFQGIGLVAPGHALAVDGRTVRTRRYWQPDPARLEDHDAAGCVAEFRESYARAVSDRIRGVEPVGISLSGGTDSGSIASTVGWLIRTGRATASLRAYSWGFATLPDSDERSTSDLIVEHYGFGGVTVEGDDAWPLAGLPAHGPDLDDAWFWPYQALIDRTIGRAAEDGVRVLLGGDRGDELLGDWVFDEVGLARAGRVRAAIRDLLLAGRSEAHPLRRFLRRALFGTPIGKGVERAASVRRSRVTPALAPWIPRDFADRSGLADRVRESSRLPRFDGYARSQRYQRIFLPQASRISTQSERRHAARGLSFADPYSDRRLVELVLGLPQWLVQRRDHPKQLLIEAMRGIMPEGARRRVTKTIPQGLFDRGLREREVETVRSLLTGSRAAAHGWLDEAAARSAYDRYVATGETEHDFWWVIAVESWLRRWWT